MNYLVEWSEDLQTWKPLASGITEQDETTILDRAAVGKRYRFYRVSVGE
jgi:hypothetical protein